MAPATLAVVVVDAAHESAQQTIESPLSDDVGPYNDSSAQEQGGRSYGDGVREGPEPADSVNPPAIHLSSSRNGRNLGGGTQRGRQPTRDVAPAKKGSTASCTSASHLNNNHNNSVLTAYRSRSLSAGRTRPRPSFDIVQDVYDRIGVTYNRGEVLAVSPSFVVAPSTTTAMAAAAAAQAAAATAATRTASAEQPSVPALTADAAERVGPKALNDSIGSGGSGSSSITRIYRAQGSTVSSPLREKFQKRYFPRTTAAATAASRFGGAAAAPSSSSAPRGREALLESLERRRSRSLSRNTRTTSADVARSSNVTSTGPSPTLVLAPTTGAGTADAMPNRGTWPPSRQTLQVRPTDIITTDARNSSPTHSQSVGSLLLKKKQGPFETPVAPPLPPPPTDGVGASAAGEPSVSSDVADESSGIMPSVKDRMAIFGGNAKSNASQSKTKKGKERTQPRDYPPKVDIYAMQTPAPRRSESSDEAEDEKKDEGFGEYESNLNKSAKRLEGGGTAGVGSSQSSGGAGSRFSRNSTPNTHNLHPQAPPYRASPLLATNFTSEPQSHAARNFSAVTPHPRQAPQQRIGIKYTPVVEIPVDETGANDNNSFVSSLGADETAIVKQPAAARTWQLQPRQMSPTAAPPIERSQYRYTGAAGTSPASAPAPPCVPAPSSSAKPSTLTTDWMEKMVEERLQAHLAVLEVHMDNQLRHATMQIERQMTTRLAALEDQISALVQAQQQPPAQASAATGESNPSRGGYVAGGRRGW